MYYEGIECQVPLKIKYKINMRERGEYSNESSC